MKTALFDRHLSLGARIVPFAGWEMPLSYSGTVEEHRCVRERVGLFDVSHMGRIMISGKDAERLLEFLSVNRIRGKQPGTVTYTVWCNEDGTCAEDTMVYKIDERHFFAVANASNREKDLARLRLYAETIGSDVEIRPLFENHGILALQGPMAFPLLGSLFPGTELLKPMHVADYGTPEDPLFISRTGYTGAGGFEIYGSNGRIVELWDRFTESGRPFHMLPAGLGARDTLRLEAGFALYGHELSDSIYPDESVSAWTIKPDKSFVGKQALEARRKIRPARHAYGVRLIEGGIPRKGCAVEKDGAVIGTVTSGGFSPGLNQGIALILVENELQLGARVAIDIRGNRRPAEITELPFVRKTG